MAKVEKELNPNVYAANSLIKNIYEKQKEIDTITAIANKQKDEITNKVNLKVDNLTEQIKKMKSELSVLSLNLDMKETKTQKKLQLLDGTLIVKKSKKTFIKDDKKLLSWALKNAGEYVTTEEVNKLNWADFKKELVIDDDKIINANTGEIVECDGLTITETTEEIDIKF